jgi:hypothetical protein
MAMRSRADIVVSADRGSRLRDLEVTPPAL